MSKDNPTSGILDSFPSGRTPRPQQVQVLRRVEEAWNSSDVIVIDAPVATGKSLIAQTISRWALKVHKKLSRVLTPTNVLVSQYVQDFPYLHTLPSAESFTCVQSVERYEDRSIKYQHPCSVEKSRGEKSYCSNCPYLREKKKGYATPYGVYNYYTYIANKYYRPVLIIDEAHNLLPALQDLNAKKYWQKDYHYPSTLRTYQQLYNWLNKAIPVERDTNRRLKLEFFRQELINNRTRFIVDRGMDMYRGEKQDCIKLLPVDVRNFGGLFWPQSKVEKVILLSATISRKDIENLGLDKKRVTFVSCESPIPPERRPIYLDCSINLSYKHQHENLSEVITWIRRKLQEKPERGIIHLTYSLSNLLYTYLQEEPRLMWHSSENKMQVYRDFLAAGEGKVLMACGLYEGIDLPDDLGRWQVLLKVPYPSLESPAIKFIAENDEEHFANETIKIISQMSGRICRTPTDYGESYILDSSFKKLYEEWDNLFPDWFKEGVVDV